MATVEKISIALTEDLAALVRKAVESGDYASTSEVIRDALRDWKLKRAARDEQISVCGASGRKESIAVSLARSTSRLSSEKRARLSQRPAGNSGNCMPAITLSQRAKQDLQAIWAYIANDKPRAADQTLDTLNERVQLLADNPKLGPLRTDIAPDLR